MTDLYELLKTGYTNDIGKQRGFAEANGLVLLNQTNNHQAYYNPDKKKLIYNVNGTQNTSLPKILEDWNTNVQIGLGRGEKTARVQDEKGKLERSKRQVKDQYGVDEFETVITGHSQGRKVASAIGGRNDKVITFNGASPPLGKLNPNETHYRVGLDPVSAPLIGNKNKTVPFSGFMPTSYLPVALPFTGASPLKLLNGNGLISGAQIGLQAHEVEHLKGRKIKV